TWERMKSRCSSPSATSWRWYGGKGIRVCDEWLDYAPFRAWALASGFAPGLSIDRIDAGGNYEPGNCRFVTRQENSRLAREAERLARMAA
ncbi:hypothetical protein IL391_25345, partial [Escherichia coli]|nr:hypothetical protein [Escherichia coli]